MGSSCQICRDQDDHDVLQTIDPHKISIGIQKPHPPQPDMYRLSHEAEEAVKLFENQNFHDFLEPDILVTEVPKYVYIHEADVFYKGQWRIDKPFGAGQIILKNGGYLRGLFANNLCYGKDCLLIFPNGSYYRGGIANNKCEGFGKFTSKTHSYQGQWKDNFPHGQGKEVYANGDIFQGRFQKGLKAGDFSTYRWANNLEYKRYVGSFVDGKISGRGTVKKMIGITMEAVFQNDQIHDAVIRSQKATYTGEISNNVIDGQGKLSLNGDKQVYQGQFHQGNLHGKFNAIDEKGRTTETIFYKGRRLRTFKGLPEKEIDRIIEIVETSYDVSQRHSQALTIIQKRLGKQYNCKFIEPFEARPSKKDHLILDICQKVILFEKA